MPDDRIFGLIIDGTLVCCAVLFFFCYVPMINAFYRKHRLPVVLADEAAASERRHLELRAAALGALVSTPSPAVDPFHLASVFGRRAIEQIKTGRDPYEAARLAGSYGCRALNDRAVC